MIYIGFGWCGVVCCVCVWCVCVCVCVCVHPSRPINQINDYKKFSINVMTIVASPVSYNWQ